MKRSWRHVMVVGLLAVAAPACANILGDGFTVDDDDTSGNSGSTSGSNGCAQGNCGTCATCDECSTCETTHDCSQVYANCNNSGACVAFANCYGDCIMANCGTSDCQACYVQCGNTYPDGEFVFFDIVTCNCDACSAQCASTNELCQMGS